MDLNGNIQLRFNSKESNSLNSWKQNSYIGSNHTFS